MLIKTTELHHLITAILTAAKVPEKEADIVAEHLVRANLTGHDSHGVGMLPTYLRSIKRNLLQPGLPADLKTDQGSILISTANVDWPESRS